MVCASCKDEFEELRERLRQLEGVLAEAEMPFADIESLTQAERRLLALLGRRKGSAVAKESIYAVLYPDYDVDPKIIDVHICKIRKKLDGYDRHIKTHWAFGYSLENGEDPLSSSPGSGKHGRVNRYTADEDDIIRTSTSIRDAAEKLCRTPNGVWARAQKIGHSWGGQWRKKSLRQGAGS